MAEELAVEDELKSTTDYRVIENDDDADDHIHLEGTEKHLGGGEKDVRHHIELGGVFAVFGGFVLGEGPFTGTGTVESIGEFGGQEDDKSILGGRADKSQH